MSIGPWICDVCGKAINSAKNGYVVWDNDGSGNAHNFTVIHQSACDDNTKSSSAALEDFLGEEGLARLLTMLSLGPIKNHLGQGSHCQISDFDHFVDFFRRMQTPFYEQARVHFNDPNLLNDYADDNELGPYVPNSLDKIAKKY